MIYIGELLTALFGTSFFDLGIREAIGKPHTLAAATLRELILSIVIASALGFISFWFWHYKTALWVWVMPVALLSLLILGHPESNRSVLQAGSSDTLSYLGLDFSGVQSYAGYRMFYTVVIPTLRTLAYSGGALLALLIPRQSRKSYQPT
ncbi:MAG TPA: hypothetical protein VGL89_00570 [Candidatus Koribacter sp.]